MNFSLTATLPENARITSFCKEKLGVTPKFICSAPGRVNIIGEHIDYNGYAVLPMALEQNCTIAVCDTGKHQCQLLNTNEEKFPSTQLTLDMVENIPQGRWFTYFLCGIRAFYDSIPRASSFEPLNFCYVVDGNVPVAAGLSSSSALVCASTLAACAHHRNNRGEIAYTRSQLAEMATSSERHCGIVGGGMDQAISFLAEEGSARVIRFAPSLTAEPCPLPQNACFVVANCLRTSAKAETAQTHYNLRVKECRLAAALLLRTVVEGGGDLVAADLDVPHGAILSIVQQRLNVTLAKMQEIVNTAIREGPFTVEQAAEQLNITVKDVLRHVLHCSAADAPHFLQPRKRALHVYAEADRVESFAKLCKASLEKVPDSSSSETLAALGVLMSDSFASCRDLYECSCDELNELCSIAMQGGALGARLTGAGWGGCAVFLLDSSKCNVEHFVGLLKERYFGDKYSPEHLFATKPASGASIWKL